MLYTKVDGFHNACRHIQQEVCKEGGTMQPDVFRRDILRLLAIVTGPVNHKYYTWMLSGTTY